jgi:hypothetical protein
MIRVAAAVILIVGAGLVHGKWTNRWGPSPELTELARRFDSVPMVIGDWQGRARELPALDRAVAGAEACLSREYSNPARGITFSVLLLGGLPGRISTHTPDVCYTGAGFTLDSPAPFTCRYGPDATVAKFNTALATRGGTNPSTLRIFWGWNASKGWSAPDDPRLSFAAEPALCKLYIVRETGGTAGDPQNDPCNDLMKVLLPELDRLVFANPR